MPKVEKKESLDDYLLLENISCVDAKGRVFDEYEKLLVSTRPIEKISVSKLSLYLLEDEFIPSFALLSHILIHLANNPREEYQQQFYDMISKSLFTNTQISFDKQMIDHTTPAFKYTIGVDEIGHMKPNDAYHFNDPQYQILARSISGIQIKTNLSSIIPGLEFKTGKITETHHVSIKDQKIHLDVESHELLSVYPVKIPK